MGTREEIKEKKGLNKAMKETDSLWQASYTMIENSEQK